MRSKLLILAAVVLALSAKPFINWQNNTVGVTRYSVVSEKIPPAFDGFKILQLSDIQGGVFGNNNDALTALIEKQHADMVVLTGDLVDEGVAGSLETLNHLLSNTDLPDMRYAVSGNHDKWTGRFDALRDMCEKDYGVRFLEDESVAVAKDGETLALHGISDPSVWDDGEAYAAVLKSMKKVKPEAGFNILLFHRANMLDIFDDKGFDLILSGHIHGGQVRIPFVGGLKSPHGDWFPKYSGGRYRQNGNTYIVSRGIGNAVSVPRIFNRPEIVVVTLKAK